MRHTLRSALIRYREGTLVRRYAAPRERSVLRRKMIEELLRVRPRTREELMLGVDPKALHKTDPAQLREIPAILEIVRAVEHPALPACCETVAKAANVILH